MNENEYSKSISSLVKMQKNQKVRYLPPIDAAIADDDIYSESVVIYSESAMVGVSALLIIAVLCARQSTLGSG